jgi:ComF family protein
VGQHADGLGQLIRSYKYQAREELEPLLAGWLAGAVTGAEWLDRIEAIVAVPTHWKHRLARPLYAADALAAAVARRTEIPCLPVLKRTRAGPHQIGLSYTERLQNVRGAFAIRHRVTLREARLLLIDDVMTTGATVNECAKILRGGGAAEIYAAVLVTAGWDRSSRTVRLPT